MPPETPGDYAVQTASFYICQLIYRIKFLFNKLKNKALLQEKAGFSDNPLLANEFLLKSGEKITAITQQTKQMGKSG
ncbi:hypothetical protein [Winslowiella iniecta]|nr:hypothetical protein [Winslowiella iniecta]KOC91066.1 hypothetical protein NG42_06370 [Winslowiella iniecta]